MLLVVVVVVVVVVVISSSSSSSRSSSSSNSSSSSCSSNSKNNNSYNKHNNKKKKKKNLGLWRSRLLRCCSYEEHCQESYDAPPRALGHAAEHGRQLEAVLEEGEAPEDVPATLVAGQGTPVSSLRPISVLRFWISEGLTQV